MGTKHGSDFDPDYRWNSYVPHLLDGDDTCGYPHDLRTQRSQDPTTVGHPHPSRQSFGTTRRVRYPGSHLGSTLKPGGAVLTRGVFRRSGSVACIRVAASPNEVLTSSMMHDRYAAVKPARTVFAESLCFHRPAARGRNRSTSVTLDQPLEAPDGVDELLNHVEHHRAGRPHPVE
jgi:hypothetical protein